MKKLILLTLLLFVTINITIGYEPKKNVIEIIGNELCMKNIILYMEKIELDHIPVLRAQIRHETGNLKKINHKNNLFGFRYNTYKTFPSWKACLDYAKKWQMKRSSKYDQNSVESYLSFLINIGYASDTSYIENLRKYKTFK